MPPLPLRQSAPAKKALLVGIQYKHSTENGELRWPHRDVREFERFIVDEYGYSTEDVTLMLDDPGTDDSMQPTRQNLLRELRSLVEGALPNDRFLLYYSGHSRQVQNRTHSEDDDMDEAIIPCDDRGSEEIKDNTLKEILIDHLPVDCTFTAIFDTCHSGTMLDLNHAYCNNVFVPFLNKGLRDPSPIRNHNVRRMALASASGGSRHKARRRGRITHQLRLNADQVESTVFKCLSSAHRLSVRKTALVIQSRLTQQAHRPPSPAPSPNRASTEPSPQSSTFKDKGSLDKESLKIDTNYAAGSSNVISAPGSPATQARRQDPWMWGFEAPPHHCDSPIAEEDFVCNGFCVESPTLRPRVVALASCGDCSQTWESMDGETMTSQLMNILRRNKHMPFNDVMTELSYQLYELACEVHKESKDLYKKSKHGSPNELDFDVADLEMNDFIIPQVSSNKKLDMSQALCL